MVRLRIFVVESIRCRSVTQRSSQESAASSQPQVLLPADGDSQPLFVAGQPIVGSNFAAISSATKEKQAIMTASTKDVSTA